MRKPNDAIRTPTPTPKAGPRRVLLVEDDTAVRTLARRLLQDEGHTVIDAPTGEVVYVSSYFADAVAGLDMAEPVELLEKPFTPASLAAAVDAVLGLGDEP